MTVKTREPAAKVGTYLTDGKRLAWVVEADAESALLEDASSFVWFHVTTVNLRRDWRPVIRSAD